MFYAAFYLVLRTAAGNEKRNFLGGAEFSGGLAKRPIGVFLKIELCEPLRPHKMEEDLQSLHDQIQALRTENQRLLRQGSASNNSASELNTEARTEQPVYLPRERKCSQFSGACLKGSLSLEEWIEEVQTCIRGRYMSNDDKALFVYDHLEGEACTEIKYRPSAVREDPDEIFEALQEVYGRSQSL